MPTKTKPKLKPKPCPFCGDDNVIHASEDGTIIQSNVLYCPGCCAEVSFLYHGNDQKYVADYNRRAK